MKLILKAEGQGYLAAAWVLYGLGCSSVITHGWRGLLVAAVVSATFIIPSAYFSRDIHRLLGGELRRDMQVALRYYFGSTLMAAAFAMFVIQLVWPTLPKPA